MQKDFISNFSAEKWVTWSPYRRLSFLQKIEDSMAVRQGRRKRRVRASARTAKRGVGGEYDSDEKGSLFINKDWIYANDTYRTYELIDTVIHEGRHAYQDDVVRMRQITKARPNKKTITVWRANTCNYGVYIGAGEKREDDAQKGELFYRYQPTEEDAYKYAEGAMREYRKHFGADRHYKEYMSDMARVNQQTRMSARQLLGENYRKRISSEILKEYAFRKLPWRKRHPKSRGPVR